MILFKHTSGISRYLANHKKIEKKVGFVPTMGALHEGHLNLVRISKKLTDITVCSIFINPTQFNDPKDFEKYPVTLEKDLKMLANEGTDIVFLPDLATMYPNGTSDLKNYDLGNLESVLEGKYRPGHFQGVCQVVHRLLDIVSPDVLFMGQKDYQQCMVVKRLIDLEKIPTLLKTCPTVREPSGLAMSSRNLRLSEADRSRAALISQIMSDVKKEIRAGDLSVIRQGSMMRLEDAGFRVDYLEICKSANLTILENWDGTTPIVVLVAAFLGDVRLIDNLQLVE